ncbi:MAG: hypothetical protein HY513_04630 [Candidatus Aenigmarchaeota archaeon]|nr:hypothetical protein [Candidatus Aenigmarchaeota archaeon]
MIEYVMDRLVAAGHYNYWVADAIEAFDSQTQETIAVALCKQLPERIVGELGTANMSPEGRILEFNEKPARIEDIKFNMANTGIYVFSSRIFNVLAGQTRWSDFGKHVFPGLVSDSQQSVYGFDVGDRYWNDVGTIEAFWRTNMDLIDGIKGIDTNSKNQRDHRTARIAGRVDHSIIEGAEIQKGAYVRDSVIAEGCVIEEGAQVEGSVIFSNTRIKKNARVKKIIVDSDCEINPSDIGEFAVIGNGCTVAEGEHIVPNARVSSAQA